MIIGMGPMALSAELNAPLGRAVIGGLVCATVATLLFVPAVFRLVHERKPKAVSQSAPNLPPEASTI
jgi:multidrug efflux pump subunit AcrB